MTHDLLNGIGDNVHDAIISDYGKNSSPSADPNHAEPIKILIVDDEPKNLVALETVLDDPGYRLIRATSGNEALLALVAHEFALMILDIQMPEMNGFELAQIIKQRKKTASIPIIFLTAYFSEDQHVMEGYSSGAVDYLHKPINSAVLRSKVAIFAMLHRKTHESQAANRALLAEVAEHQRTQGELRMLNFELEDRIAARTVELRDSEGRFRALAEEMPHLVWETQADGSGTFQNAKWRSYTGVSQIYQEDWRAIVHPEEVAAMLTAWEGSLQTGTECDTCCRLRRAADGSYRWFRIKAAPVRNHSGSIIRWVGTCTDVHEQRVAEEALVRADRRKDEFLAMLGHELRNPLAAIRHAIHLNNASENHAMREWANNVIARQTIQLSRMVDDLLDVARISRGRIELRLESLALDVILAQAIEAVRPSMNGKNHLFEYETPAEGFHVRGDAARLEQIFVNLLSNAVKYTPHGGRIVLSARRENDDVVISVSDNGIGIPPDILPYVFDLFTQGTTALDRAQGGLGIGLTVVRSLTEMHGGRVKAESGGRITGAIFTVWLPLLPKEELPVETVGTKSTADKLRKSLRVLIVDDHVDAAQTLALLFTHRNCDVRIAHDGPSGIAAAKEFLPEVLLLDLGLPGVDGYQVASSLRSEPKLRDALFIAISGYAQEADRERSLAAGFDHHCAKPIEFSSLIALIDADSPHPESATH